MQAPQALLSRIATEPAMAQGQQRLVVVLSQLGDFDSLEYAEALVQAWDQIAAASIQVHAIGIGNSTSADRFCAFTGFPRDHLSVDPSAELHQELGLYAGLSTGGGPWTNLLLMCAGIGSPGTLKEVIRGYTGDRSAPARLDSSLFDLAGQGFQRPFELATVRLNNMVEVLGRWSTYVPDQRFLCQRGGTYLIDGNNELLYHHQDQGILGFSETMANPLMFLKDYLNP
ncbi:MAG: peroxiredoxin-like family protein [Synechococcus sp.]